MKWSIRIIGNLQQLRTISKLKLKFMNMIATEGFVLIATGDKYRNEACEAVSRIRAHAKGRKIYLYTDDPSKVPKGLFDRVLLHPESTNSYRDKIPPLRHLPFKRTIFLDCDVELLSPVCDIFEILKYNHFVGCHAPVRWCQWQDPDVPHGFCEVNSGVLGMTRCALQQQLIRKWQETYDFVRVEFDQASLRSSLWWAVKKGLRVFILPPEYNLRTPKPWLVGPGLAVKIVHGRIPQAEMEDLKTYLNTYVDRFRSSEKFPTQQNSLPLAWPFHDRKRLFILGAGRSGTSLTTSLFRDTQLYMGSSFYEPRDSNPIGFFEDREVNRINEQLLSQVSGSKFMTGQRWLCAVADHTAITKSKETRRAILKVLAKGDICLKDPRFCHTLPLWLEEIPTEEHPSIFCLCVYRHPAEVLTSTLRELKHADYLQSLQLTEHMILESWYSSYRSVLTHYSDLGNWLFISFSSLFTEVGIERIEAFTGLKIDMDVVNLSLYRSRPPKFQIDNKYIEMFGTLQQLSGE